jgi:anaerobic magnesium-protoporphyrin IX monomethyl ester cyclase
MRIALVTAPYDTALFRSGENLGIKYLAAYLEQKGMQVDTFEPALESLSDAELVGRLVSEHYDAIGFSVTFDSACSSLAETAHLLRLRGCHAHITLGGHSASFNARDLLERITDIDSVVRFEGELTLLDLLSHLDEPEVWHDIAGLSFRSDGRIVSTPDRGPLPDLDVLPYPKRDSTSRHLGDPHFMMTTSRGCPHHCTFCSVPAFNSSHNGVAWRFRTVPNMIGEVEYLLHRWDAKAISFIDDEFLSGKTGRQRAAEFATEILHRDLRFIWSVECRATDVERDLFQLLHRAGLQHVFIGVESASPEILRRFRKGTTPRQNYDAISIIRNLGLSIAIGFIMFDPWTTFEQLQTNLVFLADTQLTTYKAVANKVSVYRGSELEKQLSRNGKLVVSGFMRDFTFEDPRMSLAYSLVRTHLKPWNAVDQGIKRLEFALDSIDAIPVASIADLREDFGYCLRNASASLTLLFGSIIEFARGSPYPDEMSRRRFNDDVEREVGHKKQAILLELDGLQAKLTQKKAAQDQRGDSTPQ